MVIVAGGLHTLWDGRGHQQGLEPQMRQQQEELTQQQGIEQQREQQPRDEDKKSASFLCNLLYPIKI